MFSTLHTTDSMQTVERMINLFPTQQHKQIQIQIASTLKAAISQILLPRADGKGMVAAREIMLMNPSIEGLIRDGKTAQIYGALEAGHAHGMINMDKAIVKLVRNNTVTAQVALEKCHHHDTLQSAFAAMKK